MGQSTDAYIWYALECENENESDLPDSVSAKLRGLIPELSGDDVDSWEYTDRANKLLEPLGCAITSHCSCDYPVYVLAIKDSEVRARRGYPKRLDCLLVGEDWQDKLRRAAELIAWPSKGEPTWLLASMWC